ncbi:hypothetical protein PMIN06_004259 [Paraphaeosphaeria minitans]
MLEDAGGCGMKVSHREGNRYICGVGFAFAMTQQPRPCLVGQMDHGRDILNTIDVIRCRSCCLHRNLAFARTPAQPHQIFSSDTPNHPYLTPLGMPMTLEGRLMQGFRHMEPKPRSQSHG